ncbi:unnamed protein product, partial [Candidula unifasciata]
HSTDEYLSKHEYWQQRYRQPSKDLSFDWFVESPEILDFILHSMKHSSQGMHTHQLSGKKQSVSCLDLGCGTSSVWRSILANSPVPVRLVLLDFVQEALHYQKQHVNTAAAAVPESCCHLVCADVTNLPFADGSFHLAMDKGTMDALLKDRSRAHTQAIAMMSEVDRTLTPGGRFLQISDEDPDARLVFLDSLSRTRCHVSDSQAFPGPVYVPALDSQCCPVSMNTSVDSSSSDSTSTVPASGSLFSTWSFQVIASRWHREYFLYWKDKL